MARGSSPDGARVLRLTAVARQPDGIFRDTSVQKLESVADQLTGLAAGRVVFALTEGWRTVYERLLRSPGLRTYRSVAWVRTPDYWQDPPGRQSMRVNFEAAAHGVAVERTVILADALWPARARRPVRAVLPWIEEQHTRGVRVSLVREAEAGREPDLLADTGLYGTRAVGVQELDDSGRTLKVTLDLDPQAVRVAEERWRRLALYAVPFGNIRDDVEPSR
ncbi:MAG TPA: hypothetical protein VH092_39130 [Urbifossiella sp.]|nr:hypothetical protein [Urbifossiella sp.]